MNILYATDKNYVHVCATSLVSLLENNKEEDEINIFILSDNLGDEEQRLSSLVHEFDREIHIYPTATLSNWLESQGVERFNGGYTTYLRLAAGVLFPNLDKILYIDCDTLVLSNIKELYETDLTEKPAAAVKDALLADSNLALGRELHAPYFCAGVMLINLDYWRNFNLFERCIEALNTIHLASTMTASDQELINYVIGEEIETVPLKYDVTQTVRMFKAKNLRLMINKGDFDFYSITEINEARKAPVILHITGYWWGRPWNENCLDPISKLWEEYLKKTPWRGKKKNYINRSFHTKISIMLYKFLPQKIYCFIKLWIEKAKFWRKRKCK